MLCFRFPEKLFLLLWKTNGAVFPAIPSLLSDSEPVWDEGSEFSSEGIAPLSLVSGTALCLLYFTANCTPQAAEVFTQTRSFSISEPQIAPIGT